MNGPFQRFSAEPAFNLSSATRSRLRRTLLKAVVGLYVFQTAIILLFVALSYRTGGTVPIALDDLPMHNPLPHAMMLTAIVVGVATVGVAVAILRRIQAESGSIEDTGR